MIFYFLMTLIGSRLQGIELKPFICIQVQDHLRFIDFTSERDFYVHFPHVRSFYESQYTYLRDDRKIKFRMVSVQHFIKKGPWLASFTRKIIPTIPAFVFLYFCLFFVVVVLFLSGCMKVACFVCTVGLREQLQMLIA